MFILTKVSTINWIYKINSSLLSVQESDVNDDLEELKRRIEEVKVATESVVRWLRLAHAALRVRCEPPQWTRDHAALQTRRDTCFSQAVSDRHFLIRVPFHATGTHPSGIDRYYGPSLITYLFHFVHSH